MKKIVLIIAAFMSFALVVAACVKKKKEDKTMETKNESVAHGATEGNTLVAYFSATGTTENVAKMIAKATGGELYKIQPEEEYTPADLDWTDKTSRCSRENADPKLRPAIVMEKKNLDEYDVIYLGYPNWWNAAPRIINTFVEAYGLKGKKVIPFMTSGGSTIEHSEALLKKTYPNVNWQKGKLLNGVTQKDVDNWVK